MTPPAKVAAVMLQLNMQLRDEDVLARMRDMLM
jgi:hypothetical protein